MLFILHLLLFKDTLCICVLKGVIELKFLLHLALGDIIYFQSSVVIKHRFILFSDCAILIYNLCMIMCYTNKFALLIIIIVIRYIR